MRLQTLPGWGLALGSVALLTGCMGGELLHRFTFSPKAIKPGQTTLTLRKGESLQFWNSLDVSYKPGTKLVFKIAIKPKDSGETSQVICNALDPSFTFMSSKVESPNSIRQSWKQARMRCSFGPVAATQTFNITALPAASAPMQAERLILELKR